MQRCVLFLLVFSPNAAFAHLGHVGELAGHAHWVGLGALVLAGLIGYAISEKSEDEESPDEESEEVAA